MSKPKLVTASWFARIPAEYAPIGISRGVPKNAKPGYMRYESLNPGPWFNKTGDDEFTRLYFNEILGVLQPGLVLKNLQEMAGGRIPALLCWEHPPPNPKWCHRALVSAWFWDKLGIEVPELGHEHAGCGWCHPKLYPAARRPSNPEHPLPALAGTEVPPLNPPEALGPDRSLEILPLVGRYFRRGKKAYQVTGVHPQFRDQAVVTDGVKEQTVHVDTLIKLLA